MWGARVRTPLRRAPGRERQAGRALCAACLACVLVAGGWAWSRGFCGPYLFDDYTTPLNDPASQSVSAWLEHLPATLRPLTKLTYAIEADAGLSDQPAVRRLMSLALHSASAGLLLLLIRRLHPTGSPLVAVLLAGTWFVHPVHADGVLFVSGRTAVLSNLFVLGALLSLDRSRGWLSALLFALACLSRETAVAALLPLAVMATARAPRRTGSTLRALVPIVLVAALVFGWMLATPRYMQLAEYSMMGRPFRASVSSQVGAVPVGLGLLVRPASLSIDYGIPLPMSFTDLRFVGGLLLYASAAAGAVMWRRRCRPAAVGLALWLAALLPTQSLVPKLDALTNRPLSLALAGLLLAAAPLLTVVQDRVRQAGTRSAWSLVRTRALNTAGLSLALALVATLTLATSVRAALFLSPLTLWRDAAAKSRVNARPHLQYAVQLDEAGRDDEARRALSTAARIDPFSSQIDTMTRVQRLREVLR